MTARFRLVPAACFTALLLSTPALFSQAAPAKLPPETPAPIPQTTTPPAASDLPDSPSTTAKIVAAPSPTGATAVIDTTMGRLTCKFFDEAPLAVANFIGLSEGTRDWTDPTNQKKMHNVRFYDGTTFHRVIPGFMIQGGDHAGNGTGDAGYFFNNEPIPGLNFDQPGRLAMANAGPNTNGTQFFITEAAQPALNGGYTIFGQCDAHTVLLTATIARVERDRQDKPYTPVVINHVTIVRDGQPMPPEPAASAAPTVPVLPAAGPR